MHAEQLNESRVREALEFVVFVFVDSVSQGK